MTTSESYEGDTLHVAVCACGYQSQRASHPRDALDDGKEHIATQTDKSEHGFTLEVAEGQRIQFECKKCGEDVDREPHKADIPNLTPVRCTECVLEIMGEP